MKQSEVACALQFDCNSMHLIRLQKIRALDQQVVMSGSSTAELQGRGKLCKAVIA